MFDEQMIEVRDVPISEAMQIMAEENARLWKHVFDLESHVKSMEEQLKNLESTRYRMPYERDWIDPHPGWPILSTPPYVPARDQWPPKVTFNDNAGSVNPAKIRASRKGMQNPHHKMMKIFADHCELAVGYSFDSDRLVNPDWNPKHEFVFIVPFGVIEGEIVLEVIRGFECSDELVNYKNVKIKKIDHKTAYLTIGPAIVDGFNSGQEKDLNFWDIREIKRF